MLTITRFVLRHRILVVVCWLALAVAGAMTAATTAGRLTTVFDMPGPAFTAAADITRTYDVDAPDPVIPVITLPAGLTVDSPGVSAELAGAFDAAGRVVPGARVLDLAGTGNRAFVTVDSRSTFALIAVPTGNPMGGNPFADQIQHIVQAAVPVSWQVRVTGIQALTDTAPPAQGAGVLAESMLGGLGALLVLVFVFASFLAIVPLLIAAVSILATFLATLGLTQIMPVSQIVVFLIALIGLGVAIDYSLLVVTRWREERTHGRTNTAAIEIAMSTAGRAVVFSGITVGVGLLALEALPVPFLRATGVGGVLIPIISVAVAITLLPVILGSIGPRMNWPRIRTDNTAGRGWTAWAQLTFRRRGTAAAAGIIALLALMAPAVALHLGEPSSDALAQSGPAHEALATLQSGEVPSGILTPIVILTRDSQAASVAQAIGAVAGVHAVVAPETGGNRRSGTALVTVVPEAETSIPAGQHTVDQVRVTAAGIPGVLGVAGSGAALIDFSEDVYGSFPLMLILIGIATFLLLARAFRSWLLPLKAVLLNLASLAAAYGVMVLIWQQGNISELLWGIPSTGAITMWVPVMVFAFLFGLSMDYEVFILTRMREAYDATGSTRDAVVTGIGRTGRLVTSAALILVLSFVAMSTTPQTDVKILATGLAAGILVDATIVRCLLVPALVSLFGNYNWWLPGWMARFLRVAPSPLHPISHTAQPEPVSSDNDPTNRTLRLSGSLDGKGGGGGTADDAVGASAATGA